MCFQKLVAPVLGIIILLGSGALLVPSQAFAACCGCGNCWMMYIYGSQYCYCGGNCPFCSTDEFDPSHRNISLNNGTLDSSSISNRFSVDAATNPLDQLSGGSRCFREKIALGLLGQNRDALKFVPTGFNEKKVQDQVSAF